MNRVKISDVIEDDESDIEIDPDNIGEEPVDWKDICFIPFKMLWRVIIVVIVFSSCCVVSYFLTFEEHQPKGFDVFYYMLELVYLVDFLLSVLHRCMVSHQKTQIYPPKRLFSLVVDGISLLPYYELYYLLSRASNGKNHKFINDNVRWKVLLRLHAIPTFFTYVGNTPGMNHVISTAVSHLFAYILYTTIGGCIWYLMLSWHRSRNWAEHLTFHNFDYTMAISWFALSSSVIGKCIAHNWSGLIFGTNYEESIFLMVIMLLGFLNHFMIFFGRLTALYMKKIVDQYSFSYQLNVIKRMMVDWKVGREVQKEVMDIYNHFWEQRSGIQKAPRMLFTLPSSLKTQISLDVFWPVLKHSLLFRDVDIAAKRFISANMTSEFLMPGEYLCKVGEIRSKFIYIVSGVIQILSQEDQKSPVVSFSGGTLLGEVCPLIPTKSSVNLKCASYCEVHTLDLQTLTRSMLTYPYISNHLRTKLKERFALARQLQDEDIVKLKTKDAHTTAIRWVKIQWRNVAFQTRNVKKLLDEKHQLITVYHTSKYLTLYVLSEEVELKVKTICLKSTIPFILDPNSSFRATFEYITLITIVLQTLLLPYIIFFERTISGVETAIFYALDGSYLLGLIFDLTTAIKKSDRLIATCTEIVIYKGKQFSFLVDIVATVPWEMLTFASSDGRIFSLWKINRLLRVYKVFRLIRRAELNVWSSYIKIRILKYFVIVICCIYFLTAVMYGTTYFTEIDQHGWLFYNIRLKEILNPRPRETMAHFWLSLEYVLTAILSQSWGQFFAYSMKDIFLELAVGLIGYFVYSFCFAEVGACAVLAHQAKMNYRLYLTTLKNFAARRQIPSDIKNFMYSMVQCHWQYNQRFDITGPNGVIRNLPDHLRNEILTSRIVRCLRLVPMFFEYDEAVLWRIAARASVNIFPPNTVIVREENYCSDLYVVLRGYCLAESFIPTDKYHKAKMILSIGDCFPILEMLMKINSFLNVKALSFVEIAMVSYHDMLNVMDRDDPMYQDLMYVTKEEFERNKIILNRQKGRLPEMVSAEKSLGKGDFFEFDINDEIISDKDKIYNLQKWKRLGPWSFIRHAFFKRTLDPSKTFYVIWECFRCTISLMHLGFSLYFLHYIVLEGVHQYVLLFFHVIAIADMYIRMHCRYYNHEGITVTHPLYTARHYLTTSFLTDCYCVFPFQELELHHFFGKNRAHGLMIMTIMTRTFLVHRIFFGISYVQEKSREDRAVFYHNVKYVIIVFVGVGVAASILEGLSCTQERSDIAFDCSKDSWIYSNLFKGQQSSSMTIVICYYVVVSVFATSTVGLFVFESRRDVLTMSFLSFFLLGLRWFLLAKITSSRIGGNTTLVHYQHNMKEFLKFAKSNYLKEHLIHETVSHYEYIWKKTRGNPSSKILPSFHPVLRVDFSSYLYEPTIRLVDVLSNLDTSAIRHLSKKFVEWHFKKDSCIIRCNYVTDMLYIVNRGSVQLTIANDQLALLTQGGMFGCFSPFGKTRLTITAKAKYHVDVLCIKTKDFYKVLSRYKRALNRMNRNRLVNSEFILPLHTASSAIIHIDSKELQARPVWKKILLFTLNPNSKWFTIYSYIINVHLSILSCLIIMTLIAKVGNFDILTWRWVGEIFDILFGTKLFFGFHTTYIDLESGVRIVSLKKIANKYVRSIHFWFDLFTIFPFEWFAFLVDDYNSYRFFWLNRPLRFVFLLQYYNNSKNTLTVSKHLRWTYLMYAMVLLIHINACVWWAIACPEEICTYYPKVSHEPIVLKEAATVAWSFLMAYIYVINIFTSTGLRIVVPTNSSQLITSIIMVSIAQLVLVVLTAGFASMLVLDKFEMTQFEKGARKTLTYLQKINLSMPLRRQVWQYYVVQWTKSHGPWLPELIKTAPENLKQEIMLDLYSKHLLQHFLFKKAHTDFLRQLAAHLELCVYLPKMYITEKGDIDCTMFFIHEGVVTVFDRIEKIEIEQMELAQGASFGEPQGLYDTPHERSYKAKYTCQIIQLKRTDWDYLLTWFPATKEQIIEEAARHLKKPLSTITVASKLNIVF